MKKNVFLLFVRLVYIKNKNLCIYLSQMIAVKVLHHTLLSPPSIWGHHLSVTYFIFRALSQMLSLPLVGFSSCTVLLWALKLLFVVELYISSLDPNRFDVTLESFLFGMSWSYVVPQLCFAPERLVTQIARGFNFCVDITIVVIEKGFTWKLLTTKVAHKFRTHFSEICFVLLLLGWLAVTDWL